MKKISKHKLILLALTVLTACFGLLLLSNPKVLASESYGLDETMGVGNNKDALIEDDPEEIAGSIIGSLLTWTGVIFLALIFAGGITWMTAQGNEQKIEKAKQMIVAAIFGLLIVLSAYAITAYIGGTLTG